MALSWKARALGAVVAAGLVTVFVGPAPGASAAARDGGSVTYVWLAETPSLGPEAGTMAVGGGTAERLAIFDALLVATPPAGALQFRLATSLRSTDARTWVLKLRPNLKFSDGTPLDAAAVQFNWRRVADPELKSPSVLLAKRISAMTAVDPVTLRVVLNAPDSLFDKQLAESALTFIGSPTAIRSKGANFGKAPIGAGPYLLKEWVTNYRTVLVRNPRYFGRTHVDQIIVKRVADETQRYNTVVTKGADLAYTNDFNTRAKARRAGLDVLSAVPDGGYAVKFNVTRAPFDQLRARRALAEAIDWENLNRTVFGGAAQQAVTLFKRQSPFYDDVPQASFDSRDAQRLFDQLAAEGNEVRFTLLASGAQVAVGQWLQTQLASYRNVSMRLSTPSGAQLLADSQKGNFQVQLANSRFYDPGVGLADHLSTGGGVNFGRYSNPALDAAFHEAEVTLDVARRRAAYSKVQRAIARDVPMFFHTRLENMLVAGDRVHEIELLADGVPDWTSLWRS
ncbi:MAG: extracellular solute-binding protein family 5 [Aeromicrobium sp.]|nr:extracellular solute-binding protein family 5 [Aeromicrobium sp.]